MKNYIDTLLETLAQYKQLEIEQQIDYQKFYLYSLITHSTAIEGSTITEVENQLLFDEGIPAKGKSMAEQLMNIDLKCAYKQAMEWARQHRTFSIEMLKELSALVMRNTGCSFNTMIGDFDSSRGDLRLVNVTAGVGGSSYMNYQKVPDKLQEFCQWINNQRKQLTDNFNTAKAYMLSFEAHYRLVTIHPWADGNGRMARLVMNYIQFEFALVPSKIMSHNKALYIQSLIDSRQTDNSEPFCSFMVEEHTRNIALEINNYQKSIDKELSFATPEVDKKGGQEKAKGGQETRRLILQLIANNSRITSTQMAASIGINRSAVSKHLKKLQDEGIIRREGSTKAGQWTIVECDGKESRL